MRENRGLHQPRLRIIYIPAAEQGLIQIVLFSIGVFTFLIVGIIASISVGFLILPDLGLSFLNLVRFTFLTVLPVLALFLWMRLHSASRHRKAMGPTQHRTDRLRKVFENKAALERLPHRRIEFFYRDSASSFRGISKYLRQMRPGICVVIVPRYPEMFAMPQRTVTPFEPIDVTERTERARQVCDQLYYPDDENVNADDGSQRDGRPKRIFWLGFNAYGAVILLWVLFQFLVRPLSQGILPSLWFLGGLLFVGATVLYSTLFREKKCWVAPGALLLRETSKMGSRLSARSFTPNTTPLLVWPYSYQFMLVDGKRIKTIDCSDVGIWLVLAGWLSRVPPPSEVEAKRFMGLTE